MKAPALAAVIERRILVNYRVDPDLLDSYLPAPFRLALVGGHGVAGICLIRLGRIRPAGLPAAGLRSENAAHRIAVCWDGPDGPVTGVYIPRRDTSSRLAALAGGRLFPGYLHLARFRTREDDEGYRVQVASRDGTVHIRVEAHIRPAIERERPADRSRSRDEGCFGILFAAVPPSRLAMDRLLAHH
jgi:hypothetical protein